MFKQKLSSHEMRAIGNKDRPVLVVAEEFGLGPKEVRYCYGRASNFLDEVRNLTRIRARRGLPIDSDAMMAATKDRPRKWEYLDED